MINKRIVIKTAQSRADINGELFDAELSPKETYAKIISLLHTHTPIIKIKTLHLYVLNIITYLIATNQLNASLVRVEVLEKGKVVKTYSDWSVQPNNGLAYLHEFPKDFYSFLDPTELPDNV